jgi:hypothetical protein
MKLYKIFQNINNGYDTYDSAIVCAENEEEAKRIHPRNPWPNPDNVFYNEEKKEFWALKARTGEPYLFEDNYSGWINDLSQIKVELLGEAEKSLVKGVILSSFNAG